MDSKRPLDAVASENARLRAENDRLRQSIREMQAKLREPEEIIRAIREGEVEALVVSGDGRRDEIYCVQRYEAVYRQLIEEALPYGVWLAEEDGRLIYVSRQFLEWIQTDLAALREKGQFHFLPADYRRKFEEQWAECRQSGRPCTFEYTVSKDDGTERAILTYGIRTRAPNGRPCWAGINLDVTEQKQVKEELRRKAKALEESDRRKDEFLALLGHELRNPLAVIQYGLDLLEHGDGDEGRRREVMQSVSGQVSHLNTMVNDLLDISRISRGVVPLRSQRLELRRAVNDCVGSVRMSAQANGHELSVSLPPDPVYLMADPTRLEQMLTNLLTNAVKYTPSGGEIAVTAYEEDDAAVIRIRDTGVGIAPEALRTIFDPFTQHSPESDRHQAGLGIGLTIVRRLAELHGGSIEAYSEGPGKGSEFVLRLPVCAALDAAPDRSLAAASHGPAETEQRPLRILVVEDSEDLVQLLEITIRSWGHHVLIAHDGQQGLAVYRETHPDVVMLDIGLPGMDGYELASRIRREETAGHRPVLIALTGYGQEQDRLRAEQAAFDHRLLKPADSSRLRELLTRIASLSRSDVSGR